MFSRDVEKIALLTKEEESQLVERARAGDQDASTRLVAANLRFVIREVFRHWRPDLPLMDLVVEGCLGLMAAVKRYDPGRGASLLTFAALMIGQWIRAAIRLHYRRDLCLLDDPISSDDDELTRQDLLTSGDAALDEQVADRQVSRMLAILTARERTVIELRFWHDLSQVEIGQRLNITKTRIHQIEAKALGKMRRANHDTFGLDHRPTLAITGLTGARA